MVQTRLVTVTVLQTHAPARVPLRSPERVPARDAVLDLREVPNLVGALCAPDLAQAWRPRLP